MSGQIRATLHCGDRTLQLGTRTFLMGILNVTPDSFSDGGKWRSIDAAVARAEELLAQGADVLDIGGESTRPGARALPVDEEQRRVMPVLEALVARGIRNLSVDTRNADTARRALGAGASWINDVSALTHDLDMARAAAPAGALVLMHSRGTPERMQVGPIEYADPVREVRDFLEQQVERAVEAGVPRAKILVDPGIGFGKHLKHNLSLTRGLSALGTLGAGVLYGPSRKRFLGELTGIELPHERDAATLGAICAAVYCGADIVRVHEVRRAREALAVVDALARGALDA